MTTLIDSKGNSYNVEIVGFTKNGNLIVEWDSEQEIINTKESIITIEEK